jgi:hypothetical protein
VSSSVGASKKALAAKKGKGRGAKGRQGDGSGAFDFEVSTDVNVVLAKVNALAVCSSLICGYVAFLFVLF